MLSPTPASLYNHQLSKSICKTESSVATEKISPSHLDLSSLLGFINPRAPRTFLNQRQNHCQLLSVQPFGELSTGKLCRSINLVSDSDSVSVSVQKYSTQFIVAQQATQQSWHGEGQGGGGREKKITFMAKIKLAEKKAAAAAAATTTTKNTLPR